MNVLYFLKERTKFIRHFYDAAGEPFRETIRKIEAGEVPFDEPPYSEDGEPPFMEEWSEADTALQVLGLTCISMLFATLECYLKTLESELQISWEPKERKKAFKNGGVKGYLKCKKAFRKGDEGNLICLDEMLKLSWDDCPVNFEILEQVTLARNSHQHPDRITTLRVTHAQADRRKYPQPFFISDIENEMYSDTEMATISWMSPSVHVSREALFTAIEQVEALGDWLEERMIAAGSTS